jgi:hypothetical protein
VKASAAVDLAAQPEVEQPACPACGGRLEPRGRQRRKIRPARQRAALEVDRSYAVCATCGAGLFPLDEELELMSGELALSEREGCSCGRLSAKSITRRLGGRIRRVRAKEATVSGRAAGPGGRRP